MPSAGPSSSDVIVVLRRAAWRVERLAVHSEDAEPPVVADEEVGLAVGARPGVAAEPWFRGGWTAGRSKRNAFTLLRDRLLGRPGLAQFVQCVALIVGVAER